MGCILSMSESDIRNIYKGWVPTVGGRLSFSIVGHSSHPSRAVNANVADKSKRYLICYQKRKLLDSILPIKNILAPLLLGIHGRYWFLCLASTSNSLADSDSEMRGHLFIFHDKSSWKSDVKPLVKDRQALLKKFRDLQANDLAGYFEREYDGLIKSVWERAGYYAEFILERNGETTIRVPDLLDLPPTAPAFPRQEPEKSRIEHIVCSRLFLS